MPFKHDHSKQNDSGMIAGTHLAPRWPNQRITTPASSKSVNTSNTSRHSLQIHNKVNRPFFMDKNNLKMLRVASSDDTNSYRTPMMFGNLCL